jgi:hypothetical protein
MKAISVSEFGGPEVLKLEDVPNPRPPQGNLAPEDCMFSRNVIAHSYSHFANVVSPQLKKSLSPKTGQGFTQHLRVLEKAHPRAYYDYAFQTVEYSDHGNLLERFVSLPVPKCLLYGSENRHLSYLEH